MSIYTNFPRIWACKCNCRCSEASLCRPPGWEWWHFTPSTNIIPCHFSHLGRAWFKQTKQNAQWMWPCVNKPINTKNSPINPLKRCLESNQDLAYCQAQGPTLGPTQGRIRVKVKVRTWSGHGQVRSNSNSNSNSKVGPELYTKIGFHPLTHHPHHL